MSIIKGKIKIIENKSSKGPDTARYNLNYGINSKVDQQRRNSHSIISALKGTKSVLLDVNSTLFNLQPYKRDSYAMDFIKAVKSMGLEYRYRKIPNTGSQSFFGKLFGFDNKASDSHQIFVVISDETWTNEGFISSLPFYGVKYCVFKEAADTSKTLDDIYNGQLLDFEMFDYFDLTIFDCCSFGAMGLCTNSLEYGELEKLLEL